MTANAVFALSKELHATSPDTALSVRKIALRLQAPGAALTGGQYIEGKAAFRVAYSGMADTVTVDCTDEVFQKVLDICRPFRRV